MTIQLFKPTFDIEACLNQIRDCLDRGWTGIGYKTDEFEAAWSQYTGLANTFFVNSCTAALYLALDCLKESLGWQDGDEVISTPNTFVSTNHMILKNGLHPVFADVDDTLCLDPDDVERHITDRTRAVMFVGIGGNCGHYEDIVRLCQEHGLALIVDAAHMGGTKLNGACVGKEADAVCFSFHAVKNLPTADSGAVCFRDENLDRTARKKAWLGIDKNTYERTKGESYSWNYKVEYVGSKLHGNSIMAAIALAQLPLLDTGNAWRGHIAQIYDAAFRPYREAGMLQTVVVPDQCLSSHHLYQILVDSRDSLIGHLRVKGIECGVHYIANTRYPMYSYANNTCPRAEYVSDHVVSLPMHLRMTEDDAQFVASSITGELDRMS